MNHGTKIPGLPDLTLIAHRPRTLKSLLADLDCNGNPKTNHIVWNYDVLGETQLNSSGRKIGCGIDPAGK